MTAPTHSAAICGGSDEHHLWYEVVITMPEPFPIPSAVVSEHTEEAVRYIRTNCSRGDWLYDWTHGDYRSDSAEVRRQLRFLFEREDDAAMFRVAFG